MLYDEFLKGTGAADNGYSYCEYSRINKIYTEDNSMSKEDAYKLYNPPSEFVLSLMSENSAFSDRVKRQRRTLDEMEVQLKELSRKVEAEKKWRNEHLSKLRDQLDDALYTIEDKLGVY